VYSKQASVSLDGRARQAGSASTSSADRPSDKAAIEDTIVKRTRHAKASSGDHVAGVLADTDASDEPMWGRGQGRLRKITPHVLDISSNLIRVIILQKKVVLRGVNQMQILQMRT
jgi:hypothetical protein